MIYICLFLIWLKCVSLKSSIAEYLFCIYLLHVISLEYLITIILRNVKLSDLKLFLRRSAANDKIFIFFFLHPFLAATIYDNTIKNKFDIGLYGFFRDTGF